MASSDNNDSKPRKYFMIRQMNLGPSENRRSNSAQAGVAQQESNLDSCDLKW